MVPALLLAALLPLSPAQCPNGQCARPAVVRTVQAKQWYRLANFPGWLGYGSLNAAGQVVVERYSQEVVARPAYSPCASGRCPSR
jgi:hypothetical protein